MESTRNDSILFRDIIPLLSDSASNILEKKLDSILSERNLKKKLERKISAPITEESQSLESTKQKNDIITNPFSYNAYSDSSSNLNNHRSTYFSNLNGGSFISNPIFQNPSRSSSSSQITSTQSNHNHNSNHNQHHNQHHNQNNHNHNNIHSKSSLTSTIKPSMNLRQNTVLMFDHKHVDTLENMTEAAKKIQNLARGNRDRQLALKKKEDLLNLRSIKALSQNEYLSMIDTVLTNTIFNLMEEVVYNEFTITAEPIKFIIKENDKHDENNNDNNNDINDNNEEEQYN